MAPWKMINSLSQLLILASEFKFMKTNTRVWEVFLDGSPNLQGFFVVVRWYYLDLYIEMSHSS